MKQLNKQKLPNGEAAFNRLYDAYRRGAVTRKLRFNLTKVDFRIITSSLCRYCGTNPSQIYKSGSKTNGDYIYNGIDRINNDSGYDNLNCVACCKICNSMKSKMDYLDFINHIEAVHKFLNTGRTILED